MLVNELPGSVRTKHRAFLQDRWLNKQNFAHLFSTLLTERLLPLALQLDLLNWTYKERHGWLQLESKLASTEPPSFPGGNFRRVLSGGCGHRKTRPLETTPHSALTHYWFIFRTRLGGGTGYVAGGAAVPTFYVNTAAAKLDTYRSPMVVNRTKCDVTRAQSNSDGSISSEVCGVAGSSVGGLTGHPLLRSCPIIWAICAVTQSGGQRVRRWVEIKGNGVNWICLSAPT